jgi:hypothetical protein
MRRHGPHVGQHVPLIDQLQMPESHGTCQCVAAVGVAVVEGLLPKIGAVERREYLV